MLDVHRIFVYFLHITIAPCGSARKIDFLQLNLVDGRKVDILILSSR